MTRTAIKNGKAEKKAKLSYAIPGLFKTIRGTGQGSYIVRKINKPDSL